jgi:hypothetical protein
LIKDKQPFTTETRLSPEGYWAVVQREREPVPVQLGLVQRERELQAPVQEVVK